MDKHLNIARKVAYLLENQFSVFGYRFGLDPLLSSIPIFGNIVATLISAYIVWIGLRIGLPPFKIARMLFNVLADYLIGVIPVIGKVGDFVHKSNTMNLEILEGHYLGYAIDQE